MTKRERVLSSIIVLLVLVAGAFVYVAATDEDGESSAPDTTYIASVGSVGPDAFTTSYATAAVGGPFTITSGEIDSNSDSLYVIPGRTYGGSGGNVCDKEGMLAFFKLHPDRALAWARVQNIGVAEIPAFLDSLTPLVLAQNVKVTMFGFKAGSSYGYPAVLEAGTAVLVDENGMPRARCACGNPVIATKDPVKTAKEENKRLRIELSEEPSETTAVTETTVATETTVVQQEAPTTTSPDTTIVQCPPESSIAYGDVVADLNGDLWVREDSGYWPLKHDRAPVAALAELPGYTEDCVPCIDTNVGRDGVVYIAPDGSRWTSEFGADNRIYWRSAADAKTTAELMKGNPECNPCPPVDAVEGTTYADNSGTTWKLESRRWVNQANGTSVTFITDIPGYEDACDPCVSGTATYQRDAAGLPITQAVPADSPIVEGVVTITEVGAAVPVEVADDRVSEWQATGDDCSLPCPPAQTSSGDRYVDANGQLWIYTEGMWVNQTTDARRTLLRDLPGWSNNCNPCPPKEGAADGTTYVDINGVTWTLTNGRWTNPEGESRTFASDIDGWTELCDMPPCPPYVSTGSSTQIKDADGVTWTWEHNGWTSETGERRYTAAEFPGCNPCPPSDRTQWTDGMFYIDTSGVMWRFENGGWSGPGGRRLYKVEQLPGCGESDTTTPPVDSSESDGSASSSGSTDTTVAPATTSAPTPETTAAPAPATTAAPASTVAPAKATTTTVKATTTTAANVKPAVTVTACSGLGEGAPILTIKASDTDGISTSGFAAFASSPDGSSTRNTPASAFSAVSGQANTYRVTLGTPNGSYVELIGTVTARDTKGLGSTVAFQISANRKSGYIPCP